MDKLNSLCFYSYWKSTAHLRKPVKHHSTSQKNHPIHQNVSSNQPGALKNIVLHKVLPQKISPQNPQVRASLASRAVNKSTNQDQHGTAANSLKEKSTVQATGRAILVRNANSGEGHVVQGKQKSSLGRVLLVDLKKRIYSVWFYPGSAIKDTWHLSILIHKETPYRISSVSSIDKFPSPLSYLKHHEHTFCSIFKLIEKQS